MRLSTRHPSSRDPLPAFVSLRSELEASIGCFMEAPAATTPSPRKHRERLVSLRPQPGQTDALKLDQMGENEKGKQRRSS